MDPRDTSAAKQPPNISPEQLDARALARSRRSAMRRRVLRIRRGIAGLAAVLFSAAFLAVYVQLASGHDPALSTKATTAASAAATKKANTAQQGASSGESSTSGSSGTASGMESSTSSSTPTTSSETATSSSSASKGSSSESSQGTSAVTTSQS